MHPNSYQFRWGAYLYLVVFAFLVAFLTLFIEITVANEIFESEGLEKLFYDQNPLGLGNLVTIITGFGIIITVQKGLKGTTEKTSVYRILRFAIQMWPVLYFLSLFFELRSRFNLADENLRAASGYELILVLLKGFSINLPFILNLTSILVLCGVTDILMNARERYDFEAQEEQLFLENQRERINQKYKDLNSFKVNPLNNEKNSSLKDPNFKDKNVKKVYRRYRNSAVIVPEPHFGVLWHFLSSVIIVGVLLFFDNLFTSVGVLIVSLVGYCYYITHSAIYFRYVRFVNGIEFFIVLLVSSLVYPVFAILSLTRIASSGGYLPVGFMLISIIGVFLLVSLTLISVSIGKSSCFFRKFEIIVFIHALTELQKESANNESELLQFVEVD